MSVFNSEGYLGQQGIFSVASPPIKQKSTSHVPWGLINVLSFVGEIGLSLIPGVGIGVDAAATAIRTIGIGLAGATVRLGAAFGEGQVNPISEAIDFGSAFVPLAEEGIKTYKLGKSVSGDITGSFLGQLQKDNKDFLDKAGVDLNEESWNQLKKYSAKKAQYHLNSQKYFDTYIKNYDRKTARRIQTLINNYKKIFNNAVKTGQTKIKRMALKAIRTLERLDPIKHPRRLRSLVDTMEEGRSRGFRNNTTSQRKAMLQILGGKSGNLKEGETLDFLPNSRRKTYSYDLFQEWSELVSTANKFGINNLGRRIDDLKTSKALSRDSIRKVIKRPWSKYQRFPKDDFGRKIWYNRFRDKTTVGYYPGNQKTVYDASMNDMAKKLKDIWITHLYDPLTNISKMPEGFSSYTNDVMNDLLTNKYNVTARKISKADRQYRNKAKFWEDKRSRGKLTFENYVKKTGRGKYESFEGQFNYTKRLEESVKRHSELSKIKIRENEILEMLAKKLADIKPSFRTSRGNIIQTIQEGTAELTDNTRGQVSEFLLVSTRKKEHLLSKLVYKGALQRFLNSAPDDLSRTLLLSVFQSLGRFDTRGKVGNSSLQHIFEAARAAVANNLDMSQKELVDQAWENAYRYYHARNPIRDIIKKYNLANSKKFRYKTYHGIKTVRLYTLLNPLTIARAVPDSIYQTLRTFLDKRLKNRITETVEVNVKSTVIDKEEYARRIALARARGAPQSEESTNAVTEAILQEDQRTMNAFVKAGGIMCPPNRYLLGFKVIPSPGMAEGENLIMFYFDQIFTRAKKSGYKNTSGKKPVVAHATDIDLEQLKVIGVNYYWRVGAARGWYVNRGGTPSHQKVLGNVSRDMSVFIGFIPVNALRNVLSLSSSSEYEIMRWKSGRNEKHFWNKLRSNAIRTGLNRIGRLVGRYVIGEKIGYSGLRFFGYSESEAARGGTQIAGREFQRYTSALLALSVRTDSQGRLKFGLPSLSKIQNKLEITTLNSFKRQGFTRNTIRNKYEERVVNEVTGETKNFKSRTLYRTSYVRKIISSKYKSSYVRRITGVVYPRGLPGGYRLGSIKVRKRRW